MAICICDNCNRYIDLDWDTDCFVKSSIDEIRCFNCRGE